METWIVRIKWTACDDTFTGPFDSQTAAAQWADLNVETLPRSVVPVYWIMLISSPAFSADGWQLANT